MNYLSVCSGIEAASVAWEPLGWKCVGVSEIEPFPCAVLNYHFPTVPNFGDMTKFKEWNINGTVDLLAGGTPCQSFSVAGLRQGLKDPRGNLMLTFLAIAEHFKPKWILWENVPGVLSSNGGKDFGSFLGGLGELGYGFAYRVLDAQWCRTHRHPRAVPQRRRRVFVVGCLGDFTSATKVLFERESLSRYSAPRKETRERVAANVENRIGSGGDGGVPSSRGEHLVFNQSGFAKFRKSETALPLSANGGTLNSGDGSVIAFNESSFGKFRESDIAMPLTVSGGSVSTGDGSVVGCLTAHMAKQMSNQMAFSNQLIPVGYNITFCDANGTRADRVDGGLYVNETNVTNTITSVGVGTNVVEPVAYSIREDATSNTFSATPTDVGLTVNSLRPSPQSHHAQLFIAQTAPEITAFQSSELRLRGTLTNQDVSPTLLSETKMGDTELRVLGTAMQVRRLTPTECERLQGFPDGWTKIPWKNKNADECPDGPRYKALGNSMAVNCMEWLGERIQAVENGTL